jgi:hypothetical protein
LVSLVDSVTKNKWGAGSTYVQMQIIYPIDHGKRGKGGCKSFGKLAQMGEASSATK